MKTAKGRRWLAFCVAAVAALGIAVAAAGASTVTLNNALVVTGDGTAGWQTNAGCYPGYELFVYDSTGTTLLTSPDGSISLPLATGQQTFTFWGDYYPYNPVAGSYANQIQLSFAGGSQTLIVNDLAGAPAPWFPAASPSVVVGNYVVTVTSFSLNQFSGVNRVSPCDSAPGGGGTGYYADGSDFLDSTGTFTIDVRPLLPTSRDQCRNGGWLAFGSAFKNQGDCVSYVATKGKNPPAR